MRRDKERAAPKIERAVEVIEAFDSAGLFDLRVRKAEQLRDALAEVEEHPPHDARAFRPVDAKGRADLIPGEATTLVQDAADDEARRASDRSCQGKWQEAGGEPQAADDDQRGHAEGASSARVHDGPRSVKRPAVSARMKSPNSSSPFTISTFVCTTRASVDAGSLTASFVVVTRATPAPMFAVCLG